MEIIIILLVYAAFGFVLFKVAKSKNREPIGWILVSIIISPILVLLVLALMPSLKKKNKTKKRKKSKR